MRYHRSTIEAAVELHSQWAGEVGTKRAAKVWGCNTRVAHKRLTRMEEGGIVRRARCREVMTSTGPRTVVRWRWASVPPRKMSGIEWRVLLVMRDGAERTAPEIAQATGVILTHVHAALRSLMDGEPLVIDVDKALGDKGRPLTVYQETEAALRSILGAA